VGGWARFLAAGFFCPPAFVFIVRVDFPAALPDGFFAISIASSPWSLC
jgi:hypothetical protein